MGEKGSALERADIFIWVGIDALHVWDRKRKQEKGISFMQRDEQRIPYVPKFHCLWEDHAHYCNELRKALGRGRFRILLAMPEDITFIETTALEDFIYAALNGRLKRFHGLTTCPQSVALGRPSDHFIAITRTCRCYCVARVKNGQITDSQLVDAHKCDRGSLDQTVRELSAKDSSISVYYPETEENWLLMGLGSNVSFSKIATMDKAKKKKTPKSDSDSRK